MPTDTLSLSISTGVSFGLLAGIVSGVCYLIANGYTKPKNKSSEPRRLKDSEGPDERCDICTGYRDGGFMGCVCPKDTPPKFESGRWFLEQVQKTLKYVPWSISTDKLDQSDTESACSRQNREALNIRELMELLSAKLAGGPLDATSVAPLYDHPACLSRSRRVRPSSVGSSRSEDVSAPTPVASGASAHLKRLVARVVEEAVSLPALAEYATNPPPQSTFDASTYEDLLASAILNKVIERYQNESGSGGRSSGIHSASNSPTPSSRSSPRANRDNASLIHDEEENVSDWEDGHVTDEAIEIPRRVPFPEFGGDIVHTPGLDDAEFDEVSGSDLQAADGNWEENWLFQRKKIKSVQSVPVPMLVPNSNTEYRALIGDRDADDTTDLSDAASDTEIVEDAEYKTDLKRKVESKSVIGGKMPIEKLAALESEINESELNNDLLVSKTNFVYMNGNHVTNSESNDGSITTGNIAKNEYDIKKPIIVVNVESGPLHQTEFSVEEIHRTSSKDISSKNHGDETDGLNLSKSNSLINIQKDGEYEETITKAVQRHTDSLRRQHFLETSDENLDFEHQNGVSPCASDLGDVQFPETFAKREKQKWLKCVDMPNNPYSPEAIKKRLSAKSTSSMFDTLTKKSEISDDTSSKTQSIEKPDLAAEDSNRKSNSKSPSPKRLEEVLAEEVPQYKRYGRDYYIREAKKSAGGKLRDLHGPDSVSSLSKSMSLDNFESDVASTGSLIKQFNYMAINQLGTSALQRQNSAAKSDITMDKENNFTSIEIENADEQSLFAAKPVYVDDDMDQKFEKLLVLPTSSPKTIIQQNSKTQAIGNETNNYVIENLDSSAEDSMLSSSSVDDSVKIYNVPSGQVMKDHREQDNKSPIFHETTVDKNVRVDSVDNIKPSEQPRTLKDLNYKAEKHNPCVEIKDMQQNFEDNLHLPKVKDLAKKFLNQENQEAEHVIKATSQRRKFSSNYELDIVNPNKGEKQLSKAYMHSLTARSISKEFREELKMSMPVAIKTPGGANEVPEGIEEITKEASRPSSPVPEPGTIRNKLAFFESLKSKLISN